jgi:hypothetical protein
VCMDSAVVACSKRGHGMNCRHVSPVIRPLAEEEPEREGALPWEFSSPSMREFEAEVKSLVLKLSQVRLPLRFRAPGVLHRPGPYVATARLC